MLVFITKLFFHCLLNVLFTVKRINKKKLPKGKPVIIVANHRSNWDPPFLYIMFPEKIYYMAKESLFANPILSRVIRKLGAFPVKRGAQDKQSVATALKLLKENKVLGIFPEGERSEDGQLQTFKKGVATFAVQRQAVVMPMAMTGGFTLFSTVRVNYGEPIYVEDFYPDLPKNERVERLNALMQESVQQLLHEAKQTHS